MMLAVTVMAELLYGMFGVLDQHLVVLRLAETGIGAIGAALAVLLVLPITTHATTGCIVVGDPVRPRLHDRGGGPSDGSCAADPAARRGAGEDGAEERLSLTPLSPSRTPSIPPPAGRQGVPSSGAEHLRAEVRLAVIVGTVASSDRLTLACERVERAVEALTSPEPRRITVQAGTPPLEEPVLAHLHGLSGHSPNSPAPPHLRASNPVRV